MAIHVQDMVKLGGLELVSLQMDAVEEEAPAKTLEVAKHRVGPVAKMAIATSAVETAQAGALKLGAAPPMVAVASLATEVTDWLSPGCARAQVSRREAHPASHIRRHHPCLASREQQS